LDLPLAQRMGEVLEGFPILMVSLLGLSSNEEVGVDLGIPEGEGMGSNGSPFEWVILGEREFSKLGD